MLRLAVHPPPHAPYPPRLTWPSFGLRQLAFNQVIGNLGAISLMTIEMMYSHGAATHGGLYFFIWMQLIVLCGLLINGTCGLLIMRAGWRRLPDAQTRYEQHGLFKALQPKAVASLVLGMALCPLLSSWVAQQAFASIQTSAWGTAHLAQVRPTASLALLNMLFGVTASYFFEYLHDRWTHREARERRAHQLTTEAQLQLLRAQLDPHMLFNTLSNVCGLIDESPSQAHAMLLHLIGFLRSTLDGSRAPQHALEAEFRLASDYLALMQIRMGERLRTTLSLPEPLRGMPVPAMLLQPLIENAIKHGLEPRRQGGELSVAATQEADHLVLRVRNSGTRAHQQPEAFSPGGFGLHNVKDRLAMLCGPGEHVELAHLDEQDATEVTVRLPLPLKAGA